MYQNNCCKFFKSDENLKEFETGRFDMDIYTALGLIILNYKSTRQ